jgi:hypothetical protein
MTFEEALKLMREGAKIRHPFMPEDEYFQACRVVSFFYNTPKDTWAISIVHMKGEFQHPNMGAGSLDRLPKDWDKPCKHGNFPQLNLLLIMKDDWELSTFS